MQNPRRWLARDERPLQGGKRQIFFQPVSDRPSGNAARVKVENNGEIKPAFGSPDITDAGGPFLIGCGGRKILIKMIGRDRPAMAAAGGLFEAAFLTRLKVIIPRSRQNPKILWVDDAEVVGDRITKVLQFSGDFVAQEIERGVRELSACGVAFVVRDIPVHETP